MPNTLTYNDVRTIVSFLQEKGLIKYNLTVSAPVHSREEMDKVCEEYHYRCNKVGDVEYGDQVNVMVGNTKFTYVLEDSQE